MSQGKATPVACREAGISQQSYYRWRKEYGGLELDQAKRMKDLERVARADLRRSHANVCFQG
jgi:transposase-like protein